MILKEAINRISSEHEKEQWLLSVTNATLYIAAGGYISEANTILAEIWKHRKPYDRITWLADRAFEVLWYVARNRPADVPFPQENIDEIETAHRDYLVSPSGEYVPQDIIENYVKAQLFCRSTAGKLPHSDMELIALDLLLPCLGAGGLNAYTTCKILSLVTELSAKHHKTDQCINLLKQWGSRIGRGSFVPALVFVAANRHVAPFLLNGIIRNELTLTDEQVAEYVQECIAVLKEKNTGDSLILKN